MEVKEEPPKPEKKRRSRWEDVPEENTDTTLAVVPKEITICGGIRVSLLTSALLAGMLVLCRPAVNGWSCLMCRNTSLAVWCIPDSVHQSSHAALLAGLPAFSPDRRAQLE